MELVLVLPIYNAHPYFSLKTLGQKVCTLHSKIWYFSIWCSTLTVTVCIPPVEYKLMKSQKCVSFIQVSMSSNRTVPGK